MTDTHRSAGESARRATIVAIGAVVVLLYAMPLVAVTLGAFRSSAPGQPGDWTLQGFVRAYSDPITYRYLANSLRLALGAGLLGTGLAIALCWVSSRSTAAARKIVTPLMFLVLATPGLFFALSWSLLAAPRAGLLNKALDAVGFGDSTISIGGWWGVTFVLGLKLSGLCYFMLIGPFRSADGRMEEAARVAGASRARTLMTVTLPVLAPATAGVAIVAMVIGMVALEMPLIIGLPSGFRVFSTQIYSSLNDSIPPDYSTAAALALLLVVLVLTLIALKWRLLDRRSWVTVGGKGGGVQRWDLGRNGNFLVNCFVGFVALVAVVLPGIQLVLGSLQPLFGVYSGYSLDNYRNLLADPTVGPALRNTALLAVGGGLLAVSLALSLGIAGRRASRGVRRIFELATWMPWALNGVVLALGLTWAFLAVPLLRSGFGSVELLLLALMIAATPLAARTIDGALAQVAPDLEESARVHGASAVRSGIDIVLRLVLPSFLAGWLVVGIHIAGDLEVPILLSTPDSRTLSVLVYRFYADGEAAMAAALFCMLIGTALALSALVALLTTVVRRVRGRRLALAAGLVAASEAPPAPSTSPASDIGGGQDPVVGLARIDQPAVVHRTTVQTGDH